MAKLTPPALQHVARIWRPTPEQVAKELKKLATSAPPVSYAPLHTLARDRVMFHQSEEQLAECVRRREKRPNFQKDFLDILKLLCGHFDKPEALVPIEIPGRFYPVSRDLMIPFKPPFAYAVNGKLVLPWFIFWKKNALSHEQLSLLVTLVDEIIQQDPELDHARLEIIDFSVPAGGAVREVKVINTADIPRLKEPRKIEMLQVVAEGYVLARNDLAKMRPEGKQDQADSKAEDQLPLFTSD